MIFLLLKKKSKKFDFNISEPGRMDFNRKQGKELKNRQHFFANFNVGSLKQTDGSFSMGPNFCFLPMDGQVTVKTRWT